MSDLVELARGLAPTLLFDEREPFFPRFVGVSLLEAPGPSPSFRRDLAPPPGGAVLEYAVYWDWDIQHLYDLEHVWLYLDSSGALADAEGSFHGRYLKALLPGRGNLEGTRLALYSQPGKHAFAPDPLAFRLLPDCAASTGAAAGAAGAEVPRPLQGRITHDQAWDAPVAAYLRGRAFEPAWSFRPWRIPGSAIVEWEELDARLPGLFMAGLREAKAL